MSINFIFPLIPLAAIALTALGLVLLTLGVRGRPVFSSPRCGKCGYDLRNMQFLSPESIGNCPECGVALAEPGAVSFGRYQRQPRRIVIGVLLLILPLTLSFFGLTFMQTRSMARAGSPQSKPGMTTPAILASLKATVDSPWDWQELERRFKAGTLSQADVDAAFGVLINDLKVKNATGKPRQPLHWAGRFLTPAITGGNVSQPQVVALAQAYYADSPKFTLRRRVRQDEPIGLVLNEHDPWQLPDLQLCWALTGIVADGTTKLTPQLRYSRSGPSPRPGDPAPPMKPDELSGSGRDGQVEVLLAQSLPPGEHEITFTFEMGLVSDKTTMRGIDGKPGTPDKWPSPVARWQSVVTRKFTVLPKEQSPVDLNTNPTSNPFTSAGVSVEEALVRPASSKGVELVIKFKFTGTPSPVIGYRIWVQAGDQKIAYGTMVSGKTSHSSIQGVSDRARIPAIAPDVKTIDILLEPDPKVVEPHTGIDEIWGRPHRINNVPLGRFDLPGGGGGSDPATTRAAPRDPKAVGQ